MKKELAEETSLLGLKVSAMLNTHLLKIKESCEKEDFEKMRKGVGLVMGYLYTDVMQPIWNENPELQPEEMGGSYKVPSEIYDEI